MLGKRMILNGSRHSRVRRTNTTTLRKQFRAKLTQDATTYVIKNLEGADDAVARTAVLLSKLNAGNRLLTWLKIPRARVRCRAARTGFSRLCDGVRALLGGQQM